MMVMTTTDGDDDGHDDQDHDDDKEKKKTKNTTTAAAATKVGELNHVRQINTIVAWQGKHNVCLTAHGGLAGRDGTAGKTAFLRQTAEFTL